MLSIGSICYAIELSLIWSYVVSINIVTAIFYIFDKIISSSKIIRVPEILFHIFSVIGGSLSAIISQTIFRHKTKKVTFQLLSVIIFIIQLSIFLYFFFINTEFKNILEIKLRFLTSFFVR